MKNETSHKIKWENISKYLSGEMNKEEKLAFENLIASNSHYAEAVAASGKDMGLVDELSQIRTDFDADFAWNKVRSRLTKDKTDRRIVSMIPKLNWKKALQLAAMVVVVAGLGFLSNQFYKNHLSPYQTFTSSSHESGNKIILPDGSGVTLNGKARLVYPKKFDSNSRNVSLVGEAFFDIAKNPNKPFVITAKDAEIKVLGTSFNVIAVDSKVEVMVETGKVQFTGIKNPKKSLILEKGDFAVLSENILKKQKTNDDNYLSWKTHKMIFREMPLKDVAKVIERTYQVEIRFENENIANERINTTFDNDPLNRVLENICMSFSLVYEKRGNQITLKEGI